MGICSPSGCGPAKVERTRDREQRLDNPPRDKILGVVQFLHPGPEPRVKNGSCEWNSDKHKRKYLRLRGKYITTMEPPIGKESEIEFWGEWEPESNANEIQNSGSPKSVHIPFYEKKQDYRGLDNTDPFVFGGPFIYTNCRQNKESKPTKLQRLKEGTLILFGSKKNKKFILDTVFVVSSLEKFKIKDWRGVIPKQTGEKIREAYGEIIFKPLETVCSNSNEQFTMYIGAGLDTAVNGMFSFVPCIEAGKREPFERPIIEDRIWEKEPPQGHRIKEMGMSEIEACWKDIVKQVKANGLELGTAVDLPPEGSR